MAVAIEFLSVIVRKAAAEEKYPGGLDGFARLDLGNYLEDEHLVRIGFMSSRDAWAFADELQSAGLRCSNDRESDIAVISRPNGPTPPWLSVGTCEGREACWLAGCSPGKLIDLDPCMMLRMPGPAFSSVEAVVKASLRTAPTSEYVAAVLRSQPRCCWIVLVTTRESKSRYSRTPTAAAPRVHGVAGILPDGPRSQQTRH